MGCSVSVCNLWTWTICSLSNANSCASLPYPSAIFLILSSSASLPASPALQISSFSSALYLALTSSVASVACKSLSLFSNMSILIVLWLMSSVSLVISSRKAVSLLISCISNYCLVWASDSSMVVMVSIFSVKVFLASANYRFKSSIVLWRWPSSLSVFSL